MDFLRKSQLRSRFENKTVAIVGSGPGSLGNRPGFVDSHDVVVRVNNYRLFPATGRRVDVFYSFFGRSIKKTALELKQNGVTLCMCKCPDAQPIESEWHRRHGKMLGVDFRWIYRARADFWFCDTYIPETEDFIAWFNLLDGHVPTTGFSAILDVLSFDPSEVYLTGFDFFRSRRHNITDRWCEKDNGDPIGHVPERELLWLAENWDRHPLKADPTLRAALRTAGAPQPRPEPAPMENRMVSRRVRTMRRPLRRREILA